MAVPDVSVIVTTRNEENNIVACLESARKQTYPSEKIELIVVDNNSTDNTKASAKKYTDKVYNFGPERSAQRNFGVRQASGKYILCLDADMMLSERVISECVEKCEQERCGALYIPERIIGEGSWIKVRDFERSFYNATVIDCVRFVRKDTFLEVGGFDERLTGPEDWDFDRRIKAITKTDIIISPLKHNEEKFNLRYYINKKHYYAHFFDAYISKWGRNDKIIKKQLGFWYRYCGVFFEDGKIFRIVFHPLLALQMYFLRSLVGIMYVVSDKQQKGPF